MLKFTQFLKESHDEFHKDLESAGLHKHSKAYYGSIHSGSADHEKIHAALTKHGYTAHGKSTYDQGGINGHKATISHHADGKVAHVSVRYAAYRRN